MREGEREGREWGGGVGRQREGKREERDRQREREREKHSVVSSSKGTNLIMRVSPS